MKTRFPLAVVGAGLSGLSTARFLAAQGADTLIFERTGRPGGRIRTVTTEHWRADIGAHVIRRSQKHLIALIRELGLEAELVTIQGAHGSIPASGEVPPPTGDMFSTGKLCLRTGVESLPQLMHTRFNLAVFPGEIAAVRWDEEDGSFWFESEDGKPARSPDTGDIFAASGVVLAAGMRLTLHIARRSPVLAHAVPILEECYWGPTAVGAFLVPPLATAYASLEGTIDSPLRWVGFEERKGPGRAPQGYSLVSVAAGRLTSERLNRLPPEDCVVSLYSELRGLFPELPAKPEDGRAHIWQNGWGPHDWNPAKVRKAMRRPEPGAPPIILAGEYLRGFSMEHALDSGEESAAMLLDAVAKYRDSRHAH
ncbi:MAG: FAD-dependent oxidoreductase [Candidatus Sumerlaeia bacterium]|nr:FAD-dependent oxidoreductase [Candidatus Sumerlaeia bacterium]